MFGNHAIRGADLTNRGYELMSDNKKYYYLKIKDNFYDTEDIKLLQAMDNGYFYSDILMKLYLTSLKNNGKLMFKDHIPYNPKMIATITNHNVDIVEKALNIFKELGLIDILDNGAIYMADIQNFIGESSTEGDRKREYRRKIDQEKNNLLPMGQMSDERPPEIEIEIEKDIDIKKNTKIDYTQDIEEIRKYYLGTKSKKNAELKLPKLIKEYGKDQLIRGIDRYRNFVAKERISFPGLKYKNESTWWNGGYMDYLDENYMEQQTEKQAVSNSWGGMKEFK